MAHPLRLMVIGAHPDDAEFKAGGLAALYRQHGHDVLFVSATNGDAGHHRIAGDDLAERRFREAQAAAEVVGLRYDIWENHDSRLVADIPRREQMIRAIRSYRPDLVLTHRPNDYHPDHRQVSLLVQDAAYLLTVPAICPDSPYLRRDPVIAYMPDDFQRPVPFRPDVVVDITSVWDAKLDMLHAHVSQFYEWLPHNARQEDRVPNEPEARRRWLQGEMAAHSALLADRIRDRVVEVYGPERGAHLTLVEAFEACEYGAPLDRSAFRRLFPFVPTPWAGA